MVMLQRMSVPLMGKVNEFKRWRKFASDGQHYFNNLKKVGNVEKLFNDLVRIVEIEPHNYCNRICRFCGNSTLDRKSTKVPMPGDIYESILDTLSKISYVGQIRFARYSEPLALETIYPMIKAAREKCPMAELMVISNGDFLTKEKLQRLSISGLNRLHVSIYLPVNETWTMERAIYFSRKFLKRIGEKSRLQSSDTRSIQGVVDYDGIDITYNSVDYDNVGVYRSGKKQTKESEFSRTDPCMQVFYNVTIDFDGAMLPCCNLRGDDSNHAKYILGRIGQDGSLLDIWDSYNARAWRQELFKFKTHKTPCDSCNQLILSNGVNIPVRTMWPRKDR